MKYIAPDMLGFQYAVAPGLPWRPELGTGPVLCLGLLAGFVLQGAGSAPDPALLSAEAVWQTLDACLPAGAVFDAGLPKPCSEFLLHGSCHAPTPVGGMECRVQVGELVKRLAVFGDRFAQHDQVSEPQPFTRMELSWAKAYGGEGHPYNPEGKGYVAANKEFRPLPNIEAWEREAPEQAADRLPAGFAALPPHWPQRGELLGPLDAAWLRKTWPGLPRDTAPTFACLAPPDQRLGGYLQGGERIELRGLHPEWGVLEGTVPRLRVRLFVLGAGCPPEELRELPCTMETLWLFPEQRVGVLLFRGVTPVADEECEELAAVLAQVEDATQEPAPDSTYVNQCRAALLPEVPLEEEAQAPPVSEGVTPPPASEEPGPHREPPRGAAGLAAGVGGLSGAGGEVPEALRVLAASLERESRERLRELGLNPEEVRAWQERIAADFREAGPAEGAPEQLVEELQHGVSRIEAETRARLESLGLDPEQAGAWAKEPEAALAGLTDPQSALGAFARQEGLTAELRAELQKAQLSFAQLESVLVAVAALGLRQAAQGAPADQEQGGGPSEELAPPVPGAPLATAEALALVRESRNLSGCDLSRCDLGGQNLAGVDLRGALLQGVVWPGVDLCGADLRGAQAQGADLSGSRLDGALLDEADLEGAVLARCSARGCRARGANFQDADFSGSDFGQADLGAADCSGANLRAADCTGLRGPDLRLQGADLREARFCDADLSGSRADHETQGQGADFTRARCRDLAWGGARLAGARFDQALLDDADLGKADLSQASLFLAQARNAVLDKALLHQAELSGCNLFQASLRRADLRKAQLRDANLFGADLYQCRIQVDMLHNVNLERTVLAPQGEEGAHD